MVRGGSTLERKVGLPGLDGPAVEILDAALAVGMARVVAGRTVLVVERDGAFLRVAPTDDPRAPGLVARNVDGLAGVAAVTVGTASLLVLSARLAEFRANEAAYPPVYHIGR